MQLSARVAAVLALLITGTALTGCGLQPGATTISFQGGKLPPPPMEATETARYALYASNSGNALYTIELRRGEEYGFRKSPDGSIVGFARDKEIPLQSMIATSYFWKQQAK